MPLVVDTGAIYAFYDRNDSWHERMKTLLSEEKGALILPAATIPEIDYLLGRDFGSQGRFTFYEDIESDIYLIAELPNDSYKRVFELNRRYADLNLGFVDAAVIVTSETLGLPRIATTDRRHFGVVAQEVRLELLP